LEADLPAGAELDHPLFPVVWRQGVEPAAHAAEHAAIEAG
jgi:hypothetical protein